MAMIPFKEAEDIVAGHLVNTGVEQVELAHCLGRVLAQDVTADIDFPPFDKSAMDGYACRQKDVLQPLHVVETIAAGTPPLQSVAAGQCSKIMTGAQVPEGADCVFMVEQAEIQTDGRVLYTGKKVPGNICWRGEDVKSGDIVVTAGTRLDAAHVAVLVGVGCTRPVVAQRPKVEILVTGSELVSPDEKPEAAQIRETNGYQLCAQLAEIGIDCSYRGIIPDDPAQIEEALLQAMAANEVVLLCGGSSVGDFDYVPELLHKHCNELLIEKVDIKPGKPLMFSTYNGGVCFGMPGNPVSTYVLTELLVKPYLLASMGHLAPLRTAKLKLNHDLKVRCGRRQTFVPVRIADGGVERVEFHGSAHIHAMCHADGLIALPKGENLLEAGGMVDVRLL
jgi:molybdopterin molybdotransferase